MPYIYKITNMTNKKVYIGKTLTDVEKRWKEHQREAQKERSWNRPLYRAIRKYGIENFKIEQLEECSSEELSKRECHWISIYESFSKGYNATLGGDGSSYIDYNQIVELYSQVQNVSEVAKILNIDRCYTSDILKMKGIEIISTQDVNKKSGKKVSMNDLNDVILMIFESQMEAARYIKKELVLSSNESGIASHIYHVASGKRKTAYGYKWKYV